MPREALHREVAEETGLAIDVGEISAIFPMENGAGERVGIVLAFQAQPAGAAVEVKAQDDVSEAGWFGPSQIPPDLAFDSTQTLIAEWARNER